MNNLIEVGKNEEGDMEYVGTQQDWDNQDIVDQEIKHIKENPEHFTDKKVLTVICPECNKEYKVGEDPRIDAGMKCGNCTYQYGD